MAKLLGLHDPKFDEGYDAIAAANDPDAAVKGEALVRDAEAKFVEKTTDEWMNVLDAAGVPCGPLQFTEELTKDEQAIANGYIVDMEHSLIGSLKTYGPPLKMSETPLQAGRPAPALGEHTEEILSDIGYETARIDELRQQGVTR